MVEVLIVGAGPFGIAAARAATRRGLSHALVGVPMQFWRRHMPRGMLLRSGRDWHMDPDGELTFERFLVATGRALAADAPIPLDLYLDYAAWMWGAAGLETSGAAVTCVARDADGFVARLDTGAELRARRVVVAPGLRYFAHVPRELAALVPRDRATHTCDWSDLAGLAGQRVALVGGRQSAFESAALIAEAGAAAVHVLHRHDTPAFAISDWSFADAMIAATEQIPGWFRGLPEAERRAITERFWREGRLKLEPWLVPRLARPEVRVAPHTSVVAAESGASGLRLTLDSGAALDVDRVIFATGYKVALERVPYLDPALLREIATSAGGSPVLDAGLQSSVPGLHFTGPCAAEDFGPFFGFLRAAPVSGRLLGRAMA